MKINANVSNESKNGVSRSMDIYPVDPKNIGGPPTGDGLSAYEIAVKNGFIGTEQEWLDSLNGTYLKMDSPNKRAFLGDVFYEDELERTYMNLGKTKVAHAIGNKGVNIPVGDIIPSFKELVAGIDKINQNINVTLVKNTTLDEISKVFGDIINPTIEEGKSIMFVKNNPRIDLYNFNQSYNDNPMSWYASKYPNSSYTFKIYGAENALIHEFNNVDNMFKYDEVCKGKGAIINGEEYFKFEVQLNAESGVELKNFYNDCYIRGDYSDGSRFTLVAFNGTAYSSGVLETYYAKTGRGHADLIFMKNRAWKYASNAGARRFRYGQEMPRNLEYLEIVGPAVSGNGYYDGLYGNSSSSNPSINDKLNEFIMPWGMCYASLMSSSYSEVNVMDYAFGMSYRSLEYFLNEIPVADITKAITVKIRYSDVLNSGTAEAQVLIDKMTEINAANSLITFVI